MPSDCYVHGLGACAPQRILSNEELCSMVDTSDEWITTRTGIKRRHILAEGENISDLGVCAAREALAEAGLAPGDVTHFLFGTCTPDMLCPSSACTAGAKLGIGRIPAYDFNAACMGFLYGLYQCRMLLALEPDARILLVCADAVSRRTNWEDRSTCVLFGDGAGAVVVSARKEGAVARLEDVLCISDSALWNLITIGGGSAVNYAPGAPIGEDFFLAMQGREVFKHAVRGMTQTCRDILARNGRGTADVDLFVPHQANMRIIEAVGARLEISGQRVFMNVADYGNTSAASVPLALWDARRQGRMPGRTRVLIAAFGGGLTCGAALWSTTETSPQG